MEGKKSLESKYFRILGLDYGDKTVGVAVSDPLLFRASPLEIIRREKKTKLRRTLARIIEIVREKEVTHIVLGWPLNADGTEGDRCVLTSEFREVLKARLDASGFEDVDIVLWDERHTSFEAESMMAELGIPKSDYKSYVDSIAASIILQSYIDNKLANESNR